MTRTTTLSLVPALAMLASLASAPEAAARPGNDLTLLDCAELALAANSNLRLRRIDVEQARLAVDQERGAFYPVIRTGVSLRHEQQATPFTFFHPEGTYGVSTLRYDAGLHGKLPFGLRYDLKLNGDVAWTELNAASLSPQHINSLQLELTQPLLRGAWTETRSQLEAARIDRQTSKAQVEREALALLIRVVRAYWELAARRQEESIAHKLLDLAEAQLVATRVRVKAGNLSRLDLTEAGAAIAARRQELVLAEQRALSAESELLLLIYRRPRPGGKAGRLDLAGRLRPVDPLSIRPDPRGMTQLLDHALGNHPALRASRFQLRAQRVTAAGAEMSALPQLDLSAGVGGTSIAGSSTVGRPGHGNAETPNSALVGGHGTAWKQVFAFDQPYVHVGLRLELPLSSAARRREATRQRLTVRRLQEARGGLEAQIAVAVRGAFLRQRKATRRVKAADKGLGLAEENLDAAEKKFKGGIATSYDVLRVQLELAKARRDLVAAKKSQLVARAELEAAIGTLPKTLGVTIK